jgi:hypothetical protein
MIDQKRNYARFYALMKHMPNADKETLVAQYSNGRTTHLREMSDWEYRAMCEGMERVAGDHERREALRRALKSKRSAALHQMQLLGINTADWQSVDAFCRNKRIAGKNFRELSGEELEALTNKVRIIIRKQKNKEL